MKIDSDILKAFKSLTIEQRAKLLDETSNHISGRLLKQSGLIDPGQDRIKAMNDYGIGIYKFFSDMTVDEAIYVVHRIPNDYQNLLHNHPHLDGNTLLAREFINAIDGSDVGRKVGPQEILSCVKGPFFISRLYEIGGSSSIGEALARLGKDSLPAQEWLSTHSLKRHNRYNMHSFLKFLHARLKHFMKPIHPALEDFVSNDK